MKYNTIFNTIALSLCLSLPIDLRAQRPWMQPTESPVVHPDRTVTFSLKAPSAKSVELSTQFLKESRSLTRDTSGLWSITVGPIEPVRTRIDLKGARTLSGKGQTAVLTSASPVDEKHLGRTDKGSAKG